MDFQCKKCDSTKLIEVMDHVAVESECWFDEAGLLVYGDQTNTDGEVECYQCFNGHPVMDHDGVEITDKEVLHAFLTNDEVLEFEEVIEKIKVLLNQCGGHHLAGIYNGMKMGEQNLEYNGDSIFEWEKDS